MFVCFVFPIYYLDLMIIPVPHSADGNYEVRYKSNVLIYPHGEVLWVPPAIYQVSCLPAQLITDVASK